MMRNFMNISNVGKLLLCVGKLFSIDNLYWIYNVRNVEGCLDLIQFLLHIREFILVTYFMNIKNSIKPSLYVDNLWTSEHSYRWEIIGL